MFDRKLSPVPCPGTRGCTNYTLGRRRRVGQAIPAARRVPPTSCAAAEPSARREEASALVAAFVIGVASAVLAVMLLVNVAARFDVTSPF